MVDLRILRNRQLAAGVVFGLILGFALYASVFALPVFLQTLRGYTAWDTGKVILPGAIASAITMAITGRITGKVDARYLIVTGVGLFFWAMWLHYHFTLEIGMHDLLLPMILRGVGLGLIFVPLTQVAVADLRPRQLAQGTGLFNLSRQLGGSFGIAVAATLLTRFTEQSREGLRAHLTPTEPSTAAWLQSTVARMQQLGGSFQEAQSSVSPAQSPPRRPGRHDRLREGVPDHRNHLRGCAAASAALPDRTHSGQGQQLTNSGNGEQEKPRRPDNNGDGKGDSSGLNSTPCSLFLFPVPVPCSRFSPLPDILDDFESDATPAAGTLLLELVGRYPEVTRRGEGTGLDRDSRQVELAQRFAGPMPRRGRPLDEVVAHLERDVLPHCNPPHPSDVPRPPGIGPAARGHLDRVPHRSDQQFARGGRDVAGNHRDRASVDPLDGRAGWVWGGGGRHVHLRGHRGNVHGAPCRASQALLPDAWENGIGSAAPAVVYGRTLTTRLLGRSVSLVSDFRAGVVVPNRDFRMDAAALNRALEDLARKGRQIMAVASHRRFYSHGIVRRPGIDRASL